MDFYFENLLKTALNRSKIKYCEDCGIALSANRCFGIYYTKSNFTKCLYRNKTHFEIRTIFAKFFIKVHFLNFVKCLYVSIFLAYNEKKKNAYLPDIFFIKF